MEYSKVELLALIKTYNRNNDDKIKNIDKLKKTEIIDICKRYNIFKGECVSDKEVNLQNISKSLLKKDLEIYFLKQGKQVPADVAAMKKQDIIDFMELHNVTHYTPELLKKETEKYEHQQLMKRIIVYNIMKYDNVDVTALDDDNLEDYILKNDLDCDIEDLQQYSVLLRNLYNAYEEFCKAVNKPDEPDKIKSFPKILGKLQTLLSK